MKKILAIVLIFIYLSGCASHVNHDYGAALSTVKTHSVVINAPQISQPSAQQLQPNNHRQRPYVYHNNPYYQVNNTHDLFGLIFLMVFCVAFFDGDC